VVQLLFTSIASHMKLKISAYMAIVFGCVLAILEAIRNWGNWQWWPYWMIDYIMATLLILGGFLVLKKTRTSGQILASAWGVSFGAGYMSFWSHVENFNEVAHGNISQTPLTYLIGFGLISCVVGFILSLSEVSKND